MLGGVGGGAGCAVSSNNYTVNLVIADTVGLQVSVILRVSKVYQFGGVRPWADHGKIVWKSNCVAQICRMKYFDIDLRFERC